MDKDGDKDLQGHGAAFDLHCFKLQAMLETHGKVPLLPTPAAPADRRAKAVPLWRGGGTRPRPRVRTI